MGKEVIETIISGGKASAAPPLGPRLGPLGVNIGKIVSEINQKTAPMEGMDIPIKIIIDTATKEFSIEIGSPPTSALIKKELGRESKGSASPKLEKTGDLPIDHVIRVAQAKLPGLNCKSLKAATKVVLGTCKNMGILVEGKDPGEVQKEIDTGKYDDKINGNLKFLSPNEMSAKQKPFLAVIAAQKAKKAEALAAAPAAAPAATPEAPPAEEKKKKKE